jgi:hypothetical protein
MKHNQAGVKGLGSIVKAVWTLNFILVTKQSLLNVSRKAGIVSPHDVERALPSQLAETTIFLHIP